MTSQTQHWKRAFLTVALGQAVSLLGSSGVQFALIWWLAEQTPSPLMMGLSGLAVFLPIAVFSPLAGVAADRLDRKRICIAADLSMGLLALLYAGLLALFDLPVWSVLFVLCARGVGSTFQQPAIQSIIPQLVPNDQLVRTNGWLQLMNAGSFLIGPVLGAVLYAAFPLPVVLLSDVIGAACASLALAVVHVPRLEQQAAPHERLRAQFKAGLQVFREDRQLCSLVLAQALCMFFYAPLSSYYPLMTSDYFDLTALYGSAAELAFALGMILTSLLFTGGVQVRHKLRVSYFGLLGMGAASALCGVIPPVRWGWFCFAFCCLLLGAAGNVHTIPLTAYIQETVAPEKMGRAFSVLTLSSSMTMPLGLLVSGPLAERVGVAAWFLLSGAAMLLLTAGVLLVSRAAKARKEEPL